MRPDEGVLVVQDRAHPRVEAPGHARHVEPHDGPSADGSPDVLDCLVGQTPGPVILLGHRVHGAVDELRLLPPQVVIPGGAVPRLPDDDPAADRLAPAGGAEADPRRAREGQSHGDLVTLGEYRYLVGEGCIKTCDLMSFDIRFNCNKKCFSLCINDKLCHFFTFYMHISHFS